MTRETMKNEITPDQVTEQIKKKATDFARTHATQSAKAFYLMGKRDAAATFLAMIQEDGLTAIIDIANELIKHEPGYKYAQWVIDNQDKFKH